MSGNHQKQADRILALLQSTFYAYNPDRFDWVPLPDILALGIASHTRRIFELRKEWIIELRDERVDGQRRTSYRLCGRRNPDKVSP